MIIRNNEDKWVAMIMYGPLGDWKKRYKHPIPRRHRSYKRLK